MNPPNPTDDELVEAARDAGVLGRAAFSKLVGRYNGWMVGLLVSLMGDRSDAEDVAQEAFVRAYLALGRFRSGDDVQPWLRVIATRLAYNKIRDASTRSRYTDAFGSLNALRTDKSDRVATREALSITLEKLSYANREILVLHHVEELSLKEISATLGIGLSAAKMRLKRARAEFVESYNQESHRE